MSGCFSIFPAQSAGAGPVVRVRDPILKILAFFFKKHALAPVGPGARPGTLGPYTFVFEFSIQNQYFDDKSSFYGSGEALSILELSGRSISIYGFI